MGAPSAPTIVQQTTAPSADEKQAKIDAQRQKSAALMKINQDVFARSQGLRGAASMYDMAGPTPWLAGPHVNKPAQPPPDTGGSKPPGWQDYLTIGGGHGPTIPGDQPDRTVITGFNYGVGPKGDRDPGFTGYGGAPKNTGWVPPTKVPGQVAPPRFAIKSTMQGPSGDRNAEPGQAGLTAESMRLQNAKDTAKRLGLPAPTAKPGINPLQFESKDPLTGKSFALQPSQHPQGGPLPPRYAAPPTPGPGVPKPKASGLYAPPALRAAAAKGDWQTINKMTGGSVSKPAASAPAASTPAPKAPASSSAAPPQPLAHPATTATTKPTTAPAPATTLGGVAKPVVYANPNLKTIAPMPKAGLMAVVGRGKNF